MKFAEFLENLSRGSEAVFNMNEGCEKSTRRIKKQMLTVVNISLTQLENEENRY